MILPPGLFDTQDTTRLLAAGENGGKNIVDVRFVNQQGESLAIDDVKPIIRVKDGQEIDIKLQFDNPLMISQGDEPDFAVVILNLGDFPTEDGTKLPDGIIKKIPLPAQFASEESA